MFSREREKKIGPGELNCELGEERGEKLIEQINRRRGIRTHDLQVRPRKRKYKKITNARSGNRITTSGDEA